MKFLVTGGAGFIGGHIAEALLAEGHSVRVLDNLRAGPLGRISHIANSVEFVRADVRDADAVHSAIRGCGGVFHEAALVSVQESYLMRREYHDVNVNGTANVLDQAAKLGVRVVYASSSSVYGNPRSVPTGEDSPLSPQNPYGATKADAEMAAQTRMRGGAGVVGLRYFNVYGRNQTGAYAGVITKFTKRLEGGLPPVINGDGSQSRDFVHAADVAAANLAAMSCSVRDGFFNVGTGRAVTVNELARSMMRIYSLGGEPEYAGALPGDVRESRADTSLAARVLGWRHSIGLEEGLAGLVRPARQRPGRG